MTQQSPPGSSNSVDMLPAWPSARASARAYFILSFATPSNLFSWSALLAPVAYASKVLVFFCLLFICCMSLVSGILLWSFVLKLFFGSLHLNYEYCRRRVIPKLVHVRKYLPIVVALGALPVGLRVSSVQVMKLVDGHGKSVTFTRHEL